MGLVTGTVHRVRHRDPQVLEEVFKEPIPNFSPTKRLRMGFTMYDEWVWIAGLQEGLKLLGQGPEILLHAYQEQRLILQGNCTSSYFVTFHQHQCARD